MSAAGDTTTRARLRRLDFTRIRFHLELVEDLRWELGEALALRSSLQHTASRVLRGESHARKLNDLFNPSLSSDPEAVRRFQKPAPPFNLLLPATWPQVLPHGGRLDLEANFWGKGAQFIDDFSLIVEKLGESGVVRNRGRFRLVGRCSADAAGLWHPVVGSPIVLDTGWWLDGSGISDALLGLRLVTPARLLSAGKPLAEPAFSNLFPFVLRRVSAMAHAHCGIEVVDDAVPLLAAAADCEVGESRLVWRDLEGGGGGRSRPVGGVVGSLKVDCREQPLIGDLLRVASLLNLGRGSAYGAGRLFVEPDSPNSPHL